jgi:hypothetical protein
VALPEAPRAGVPEDDSPSLAARAVRAVTGIERNLCVRADIAGSVTGVGAITGIGPVIASRVSAQVGGVASAWIERNARGTDMSCVNRLTADYR